MISLINPEGVPEAEAQKYERRDASRAVVFDADGKVAVLNVSKKGYYKLPGGGIEEGENKEEALRRECIEELGCKIEIGKYLGETVEYREKFKINQHCFGWIAKVVGEKGVPQFMDDEIEDGFKAEWYPLETAIEIVKNGSLADYQAKFIIERELLFLNEAKNHG